LSERFPVCSAKEVVQILRKHGFAKVSQKWRHPNGKQVIVADHGSKPLPIGTFKSIIDGSGITADEFR
jgi:predicted RNA binding protein YcfA (HicA-like mRNA interferase family)